MHLLAPSLAALTLILALDGLWLGIVTRDFYRAHLGHVMSGQVQWWAVGLFYLLYTAAIMFFVVLPNAESSSLMRVFLVGGFLGAVAYGTYDLTNHAVIKNWPLIVTGVDILWGICMTGIVAVAATLVLRAVSS